MAKAHQIALVAVVVLALIHTGSCLKCYQCSEMQDANCKDPFTKAPAVECSSSQVCVKHVTTPVLKVPAYVNRGCMAQGYCEHVKSMSDHCSTCTTDLCNSSSVVVPSFALIAVLVIKNYLL